MAVAVDAIGAGQGNVVSGTTLSWSHTLAGTATDIVVVVASGSDTGDAGGAQTITSVKVGSTSMTSLGSVHSDNATGGYVSVWGLTSPPTGTQTITVTASSAWISTPSNVSGAGNSISFTGSNGYGTVFTNFGSSNSESVTITSTTSGNLCVMGGTTGTPGGDAATSPATLRFDQDNSLGGFAASNAYCLTSASTGSTVTPTFTCTTADFWGTVGFEVKASAAGGAPIVRWPPEPPGLNPFTKVTPTIVFSTGGRSATAYNQSASATVTTSGSLVRQVGAIKSATVTTAASVLRQIGAIKNATVTTSASLIRQIAKTVSATVTTTGSLVRSIGKIIPTVTVTTTSTVSAIKVKLVTVTATVTTAASVVRQIGKNAAATVTTSGSLQRALGKTVSAAVTTTASYVRSIAKTFSANVTTSPTVVRGISKNLAVTVVTTATASETKILGGGFSSTVYAWLPFIPDEVALGQAVTLRVEFRAADGSFPALDTAPTGRVIGWGSGADVVLAGPVAMTADGHSYYMTYTPTTKGPQSLEVRGLLAGATQFYTQGFTVRPQFDPIGLAVSDVLVSRM